MSDCETLAQCEHGKALNRRRYAEGKEGLPVPEGVKQWSLTGLREKLVKIGARIVTHGRYVTFQLAEVAVPGNLFAEILRLIAELRPPPDPLPA